MIETINNNVDLVTMAIAIAPAIIAALYLVASKMTDFFKLFYPSKKQYAIVVLFSISTVLTALLVLGGLVGAVILAILILASIVSDGASGKYSQQKAVSKINDDLSLEQLEVELEDLK